MTLTRRPRRRSAAMLATLAFLISASLLGASSPASAYTYTAGCRWRTGVLALYHYDQPGYVTLTGNSAGRWNSAVARARFFDVSSGPESDVRATETDFGNTGNDGLSKWSCDSTGYFVSGSMISYFNMYYGYYDNSRRYSVMVHELGHAFGLGHSATGQPCYATGVMHPYTDPRYGNCGIQTPQSDDISGINNRY